MGTPFVLSLVGGNAMKIASIARAAFLAAILSVATFLPLDSVVPVHDSFASAVALAEPAAPDIDIKVEPQVERKTTVYVNPIVLAIGGAVIILVVALIAIGARGGGTTIIREK
jgi:hypothetical protein